MGYIIVIIPIFTHLPSKTVKTKTLHSILLTFLVNNCLCLGSINDSLLTYARNCPHAYSSEVEKLVSYLRIPAKTELQTAEIFFYWISQNVTYDLESFLNGSYVSMKNDAFGTRKAVCQGFAELYKQMCDLAKIKCYIIQGYVKDFSYQSGTKIEVNHAWNIVFVDDHAYFVDATLGTGYVHYEGDVLKYYKSINEEEVLIRSASFSKQHLPADPRWQLSEHPVSFESFLNSSDDSELIGDTSVRYSYIDSILVYENADSIERKVLSAESAYRFNSSENNLMRLATAYYKVAYALSDGDFDKERMEKSVYYYNKAMPIYQSINSESAQSMVKNTDKGIIYSNYRINNQK